MIKEIQYVLIVDRRPLMQEHEIEEADVVILLFDEEGLDPDQAKAVWEALVNAGFLSWKDLIDQEDHQRLALRLDVEFQILQILIIHAAVVCGT